MYYDSTFNLGKDFNVNINGQFNSNLSIGVNHIPDDYWDTTSEYKGKNVIMEIYVAELPTSFFGLCYAIKSNWTFHSLNDYFGLFISRENTKLTGFDLYFSSKNDYLGFLHDPFGGYKTPYKIKLEFGPFYHRVPLSLEEWKYFSDNGKMDIECKLWYLINQNTNCSLKCAPFFLKSILNSKYNTENLTLCQNQSNEEFACVADNFISKLDSVTLNDTNCPYNDVELIYKGDTHKLKEIGKLSLNPDIITTFVWFQSMKKLVFEEYSVFTFPSLVGSIGGSLGLFLGFSFLDCIHKLLSFLNSKQQMSPFQPKAFDSGNVMTSIEGEAKAALNPALLTSTQLVKNED